MASWGVFIKKKKKTQTKETDQGYWFSDVSRLILTEKQTILKVYCWYANKMNCIRMVGNIDYESSYSTEYDSSKRREKEVSNHTYYQEKMLVYLEGEP